MAKQLELPFISRELEKTSVNQRVTDGFINATEICKAAGKNFADYTRTQNTKDFLEALSADMGIPITELIEQIKGGIPQFQGARFKRFTFFI